MNEDCGESGTVVRIEIGHNPVQMDRICAIGFLDAEAVRCARRGEGGQFTRQLLVGC
jgi:hypothetical protein